MSAPSDVSAAIQERLKTLNNLLKQVEEERQHSQSNLAAISKLHAKIQHEQRLTPHIKGKLLATYTAASADAGNEAELLRQTLSKIYEIRNIRNERRVQLKQAGKEGVGATTLRRGALMKLLYTSAQTLPLWVSPPEEAAPPLCGKIPADASYIAKAGELVAALVLSPAAATSDVPVDDTWILATVVSWSPTSGRYEVEDIDEEQQERHLLSRRRVQPLPLYRADPRSHPQALFQQQSIVMALYPQTTCFYKAVVNKAPSQPTDEYEILFEDASYPEGYSPPLPVPQRYVISARDKKTKL